MSDGSRDVIAALTEALESMPSNTDLRMHLADLLVQNGRHAEALDHCAIVLGAEPANLKALEIGTAAATAVGDRGRAHAYETLLSTLRRGGAGAVAATGGVSDSESEPSQPGPLPIGEGIDGEIAIDAFLEQVLGEADERHRSVVTLADVGGLVEVKKRLRTSFLGPLANPQLREMYGKSLRGGLLLYGPPGCGKTFLARAVAGELGARFYGVELHDILDMWLGKSEQNLHQLFEVARRNAPSVVFLDELDALGRKRSQLSHSAGRNVVVQLLSELDGIGSENEGVFVLAATNQPWDVDAALRRPGRLDRTLLVLPPDLDARVAILNLHLRDRPVADDANLRSIAVATEGFSGADLRLVCESAAEEALEASVESGVARPIGQSDLEAAARGVAPSTRSWFDIARNYALFSNDSGNYDDLVAYMRKHRIR